MPIPSYGGCIATNYKYIYYIGGNSGSSQGATPNNQVIQIFNLSSLTWVNHIINIPRPIAFQSCALLNNVLYWFGGSSVTDYSIASNEIYKYNITSNKVSNEAIAKLPVPTLKGRAIIAPNEYIYIIGGLTSALNPWQPTSMVNIFDPYNESIVNSTNLLFSVSQPTVVIVNFSIMVMGGQSDYLNDNYNTPHYSSLIQQSTQIAPVVSFSFINNSNHEIYGGSLLLFDVNFNKHPTFKTEKYIIQLFSDELNIDTYIELTIDKCIIIQENNTNSNCNKGLVIPESIQILPVSNNMYQLHVNYHYSTFDRSTVMVVDRKILNISIILINEVIFGESIKVKYRVNNNNNSLILIQPQSFVFIKSALLNLNAYIKIDYIDNTCVICDISGCQSCLNGIFVSMTSNSINQQFEIILQSNDSYLTDYISNITIIACPIGFANIGLKCI
eukprot:323805_1